jgi:hypothetical protein
MANDYYISAGLSPIDTSTGVGATNTFYLSAGLSPDDLYVAPAVMYGGGSNRKNRFVRRPYRGQPIVRVKPHYLDIDDDELLDDPNVPDFFLARDGKK